MVYLGMYVKKMVNGNINKCMIREVVEKHNNEYNLNFPQVPNPVQNQDTILQSLPLKWIWGNKKVCR